MHTKDDTIRGWRDRFAEGSASAEALAVEALRRLGEDRWNAVARAADAEALMARARALDAARAGGEALGALAGVPVLLKDNICQRGARVAAASRMLEGFVSPYDAAVVERLEAAGALVIGATNMDELAMGASSETSALGPVRNPHDPGRVPGGSSGGSAAAVAGRLCPVALGSDTGGSIRQPASHCGVVGFKPTYGRVSRLGLIAFASSLDQIGPLTRSVEDAAIMLEVIAGHDPRDATSAPREVERWSEGLGDGELTGLRVGVPWALLDGVSEAVRASVEDAAARAEAAGASLVEVDLPHARHAVATYYLIATAEASSNLARFDGVRYGHRADNPTSLDDLITRSRAEGFGAEVKRRIMLGTFVLSAGFYDAYYLKAQRARTLIIRDHAAAFEGADVILSATAQAPAFALGSKLDDPMQMYLEDALTIPASLAGLPAITVPALSAPGGLPIGAQLVAPAFDEATLLRVAHALALPCPEPPAADEVPR